MMDKRIAAEIILQAIDDHGPVQVNWNMENHWISAILRGLTMVDLAVKKQKPQELQLPGNQSNL
jgi:hypothetical protein